LRDRADISSHCRWSSGQHPFGCQVRKSLCASSCYVLHRTAVVYQEVQSPLLSQPHPLRDDADLKISSSPSTVESISRALEDDFHQLFTPFCLSKTPPHEKFQTHITLISYSQTSRCFICLNSALQLSQATCFQPEVQPNGCHVQGKCSEILNTLERPLTSSVRTVTGESSKPRLESIAND
jgi:hypothetical protein